MPQIMDDVTVDGTVTADGFEGPLTGTATRATADASGNTITTTYATKTAVAAKQDALVSGTNIKTINNTSLLGSGNIAVQPPLVSGTNIKTINNESLLGSGNITISGGLSGTIGTDTKPIKIVDGQAVAVTNDLVSTTGDQVIAGTKTFSNIVYVGGAKSSIFGYDESNGARTTYIESNTGNGVYARSYLILNPDKTLTPYFQIIDNGTYDTWNPYEWRAAWIGETNTAWVDHALAESITASKCHEIMVIIKHLSGGYLSSIVMPRAGLNPNYTVYSSMTSWNTAILLGDDGTQSAYTAQVQFVSSTSWRIRACNSNLAIVGIYVR